MAPEACPEARTALFARLLGPFILAIAAAVALKADAMALFVPAFFQDAPLVFVTGAFTMLVGMAILAAHWRWDSLAAIIVTVFGIATAARGALLLVAPAFIATLSADLVRFAGFVYLPAAFAALIGAYLTIVGWFSKPAPKAA